MRSRIHGRPNRSPGIPLGRATMENRLRRLPPFWPAIGAIFATALVLRLLIFAYVAHDPRKFYTYDSDGYDRRAMNVLRYGVFASEAQPPLAPDLERTPVYPALLAAIFAIA